MLLSCDVRQEREIRIWYAPPDSLAVGSGRLLTQSWTPHEEIWGRTARWELPH